jgi:hypothetical protein
VLSIGANIVEEPVMIKPDMPYSPTGLQGLRSFMAFKMCNSETGGICRKSLDNKLEWWLTGEVLHTDWKCFANASATRIVFRKDDKYLQNLIRRVFTSSMFLYQLSLSDIIINLRSYQAVKHLAVTIFVFYPSFIACKNNYFSKWSKSMWEKGREGNWNL